MNGYDNGGGYVFYTLQYFEHGATGRNLSLSVYNTIWKCISQWSL